MQRDNYYLKNHQFLISIYIKLNDVFSPNNFRFERWVFNIFCYDDYRYAFSQVVRSNDHESMKSHWTWISNILMIHKNDLDGVAVTKAYIRACDPFIN